MPGICGLVEADDSIDPAEIVSGMLAAMRHHAWYVERRADDQAANVSLGQLSLAAAPRQAANEEAIQCFCDGEIYNAAELTQQWSLPLASTDSAASILSAGFCLHGEAFLRSVEGAFAAAIWDARQQRLTLINDRFGQHPLYVAQPEGALLFASQIAPLWQHPELSPRHSAVGLAQFFTFGQYFNSDTSYEGITALPAASVLTCDAATGGVQRSVYWKVPRSNLPPGSPLDGIIDDVFDACQLAIRRQSQHTQGLGLALSGGLDARTILGFIDHDQVAMKTVCLGVPGSMDHTAAAQMAQWMGCQHHSYVLDHTFLDNFLQHMQHMVRLTDGQYLSQCIVMPTLPLYRELGIRVLLRGHAGELMHMSKAYAYSIDRDALTIRSDMQLEQWAMNHLQAYLLQGVDGPLLKGQSRGEMQQLALESLRAALAETAGVEPAPQRIWHLFVQQRLRRETPLSLAKFRSTVETRVPLLDGTLTPLLLSLPPEMKLDEMLQTRLLTRRRPGLLRAVNANTGTRMGASKTARSLSHFKMRALAKLGLRGYQPYERTGLWLRAQLAPVVEQVLLSEACLDRGVFEADTLRAVTRQHLSGARNHTYLLLALMISELRERQMTTASETRAMVV